MKRFLALTALSAFLLSPTTVQAQELMNGQIAKQNVQTLTSQVQWNTSLSSAENQAAREGKMVFWMHMLGTINGPT